MAHYRIPVTVDIVADHEVAEPEVRDLVAAYLTGVAGGVDEIRITFMENVHTDSWVGIADLDLTGDAAVRFGTRYGEDITITTPSVEIHSTEER